MPSNNEIALRQNVAGLQAQLAAANVRQAELVAELTKERARLDWCFNHLAQLYKDTPRARTLIVWHARGKQYKAYGDNPRATIDELIAAEAAGGSDERA